MSDEPSVSSREQFLREVRSRMGPLRDALGHWIREIELDFPNRGIDDTYQGVLKTLEEARQVSAMLEERAVHLYIEQVREYAHGASRSPLSAPVLPPTGAFFLLDLLLAKGDRQTVPGDLQEEFTTFILPRYGARRARFWFWTQTVRTIATRNPVCRWALVGGLARIGEWIFRKMGS
jgi:hypothetical protein